MTDYTDLFIRDDLADVGHIPSEAATACYSPDIIIWGEDILPDPQVYLPANYGSAWYTNVVADRENYIYCRAKNLGTGAQTGKLYLYFAVAGALVDVATWSRNKIPTGIIGQDHIKLSAAAGQVVVGDTAFQWLPPSGRGNHHCLVAQIVTDTNPNPLPASFPDVEAYVRWVLDNPAIAWRNIDVIASSGPPEYSNQVAFQNLAAVAKEYLFVLRCRNIPKETQIKMICPVFGPDPPIDVDQKTNKPNWTLSTPAMLPGGFVGSVDISAKLAPGVTWPPSASIAFEYYAIIGGEDSAYLRARAKPLSELGLSLPGRRGAEGEAIRLGSYTAQTDTTGGVAATAPPAGIKGARRGRRERPA